MLASSKSSSKSDKVRSLPTAGVPGSPPAIWAAMARQGRWKSTALALSLVLNAMLAFVIVGFANKPPDVVLVTPDGKSTYTNRTIAGEALTRFLEEQRHQPSDVTVVHFSSEFLQTLLAVNSSTIDGAWPAALSMMDTQLRARMAEEEKAQKLLQSYRAAQIRTEIRVEDVKMMERQGDFLHITAVVARKRASLVDPSLAEEDRLEVTLVERVVPRSPARPDGLEVVEYRNRIVPASPASTALSPLP